MILTAARHEPDNGKANDVCRGIAATVLAVAVPGGGDRCRERAMFGNFVVPMTTACPDTHRAGSTT